MRNFPISSSLARFLFAGCIELTPFSSNTIATTNVNKKMPSVRPKGEKRAKKKKGDITDFDHVLTGKEQKINDSAEKEVM